jgi:hypothetical protein
MKAVEIAKNLIQINHGRNSKVDDVPLKIRYQIILAKIYEAALCGKDHIVFEMRHSSQADKVPPMYHDHGQLQPNQDWMVGNGDEIVSDSAIGVRYALKEFDRELYPFLINEGFQVDVRSKVSQGLCCAHSYRGIFVVRWD